MIVSASGRVRATVGLLVIVLAGAMAPMQPAGSAERATVKRPLLRRAWPSDAVPGSLLVTRTSGGVEHVEVAPGQEAVHAAELSAEAGVVAVEPDYVRHALQVPNDPSFPEQWAHTLTNAPAAWDLTTGDPSVKVAIIDSGVDGTHPDLRSNLIGQVDVSGGDVVTRSLGVDNDPCKVGHGTFVAGVVGGVGNNATAVAGVAWRVGIVDVAAGDPVRCGSFTDSAIVAGIEYATARGVDVINLSLGGPSDTCPTAYQAAIDAARAKKVVVVAAAGNEEQQFPGLTSVPASCNGVISVASVGEHGHAVYSNANAEVDLAAPGGDTTNGRGIVSTTMGGGTGVEEGTSFSSPYVAGTVALMRSVNKSLSADAVESILESTAVRSGGRTPALGWGVVDVGAAVAKAKAGGVVPAPAADPKFPVGLVIRVSDQSGTTGAVRQAVAISKFLYTDGGAKHAVVARKDVFADALAGSALGYGFGPILFTANTGHLDPITASELARSLPPGGRVYLLGGTSAIPAAVEADIQALGLVPRRLAGTTREATAAAVATEVAVRVQELGFQPATRAILATAQQWPDAVTAGSLAAWFGYPILLTDPNTLSPATRDALAALRPDRLYVIGGTAAVSSAVATAARDAGGSSSVNRLAGVDRVGTAIAVAQQYITEFRSENPGIDPVLAIGVNLRRGDGFAHVLSASAAVGAASGIFLPIEGEKGDTITAPVKSLACSIDPYLGIVAGEADIVSDAAKQRLDDALEHVKATCSA
ncbi:MAG: N-acetylmuramoyl-L-alanine amidase [Actinomycetia bacterium]|nr:N-acetylmuramoyl-L-alanine amidase [Actinomycetes bacterium]